MDVYKQIGWGIQEKSYDWDQQQCRVKAKELRQADQKARKTYNADLQTCRLYKDLQAILGGDPATIPNSTMNTSEDPESQACEQRGGGDGQETGNWWILASQDLLLTPPQSLGEHRTYMDSSQTSDE